jgi:hypothetical protein
MRANNSVAPHVAEHQTGPFTFKIRSAIQISTVESKNIIFVFAGIVFGKSSLCQNLKSSQIFPVPSVSFLIPNKHILKCWNALSGSILHFFVDLYNPEYEQAYWVLAIGLLALFFLNLSTVLICTQLFSNILTESDLLYFVSSSPTVIKYEYLPTIYWQPFKKHYYCPGPVVFIYWLRLISK